MEKIAVTGNIASGKTVFENYLKKAGETTFCLDEATSEIYDDSEFVKILYQNFNLTKKEEIAKIVFGDREKLHLLEEIISPFIKSRLCDFFDKNVDKKAVFVFAPMLFEYGFETYFDKIIFISSLKEIRLKRLISRNNFTLYEAEKRIESQKHEDKKIEKSDFVIYNNGTLNEFTAEIEKTIKLLRPLL